MKLNRIVLQKTSEFIKLSLDRLEEQEAELLQYRKEKVAEEIWESNFDSALRKAANKLYDTDFLTDEREKKTFLKRAKEDPIYLARMLEKVCDAADVASIGSPARVTKPKQAEYDYLNDPVAAKAFGWHKKASIVDE